VRGFAPRSEHSRCPNGNSRPFGAPADASAAGQVGGYRGPESLHKPPREARRTAELERVVGPQVLRRTFNTLMLHAGVDRIVLRPQMGHCREEMTARYACVSVGAKRSAVERLEALIW
jgi:integrase